MRLTDEARYWTIVATDGLLHATGGYPRHEDDEVLTERTACGLPYYLLHATSGRMATDRRRCIRCCRSTGIPHGFGPPALDPEAAWKLGITSHG